MLVEIYSHSRGARVCEGMKHSRTGVFGVYAASDGALVVGKAGSFIV